MNTQFTLIEANEFVMFVEEKNTRKIINERLMWGNRKIVRFIWMQDKNNMDLFNNVTQLKTQMLTKTTKTIYKMNIRTPGLNDIVMTFQTVQPLQSR